MRQEQETMRRDQKGLRDPKMTKNMTRIDSSPRKDRIKVTTFLHLRALFQIPEEETHDHRMTVLGVNTNVIGVDQRISEEELEWRVRT